MSYTPKTWVDGEVIYHQDLNRMEQGIQTALSGEAKVLFVETNPITGFPDITNPISDVIYACLKLPQEQTSVNSLYKFWTYKGVWQNISQGPKGDKGDKGDPVHIVMELNAANITGEGTPMARIDEITPTPEGYDQGFKITVANLKGEQGMQGIPGHNPNRGTYPTVADAPNDGQTGDYIVVLDNSEPPIGYIHRWNGSTWANTGVQANDADFATGERVIETPLDNTHLNDPVSGALALAEDAAVLKSQLKGFTASETKLQLITSGNGQNVFPGKVVGATGNVDHSGTNDTNYKYVEFEIPPLVKSLRFKTPSGSGWTGGWATGHYNEGVFVVDRREAYNSKKEYVLELEEGETHFRTNCYMMYGSPATNRLEGFYCYWQSGTGVGDLVMYNEIIKDFETILPEAGGIYTYINNRTEGQPIEQVSSYVSSNWALLKYAINPRNTYYGTLKPYINTNLSSIYTYFWADSSGCLISKERSFSSTPENNQWENYPLNPPANAAYLYIQARAAVLSRYTVSMVVQPTMRETVSTLKETQEIAQNNKTIFDNHLKVIKNLINKDDLITGIVYKGTSQNTTGYPNAKASNKLYLEDGVVYTASNVNGYAAGSSQKPGDSCIIHIQRFDEENNLLGSFRPSGVITKTDKNPNKNTATSTFVYEKHRNAITGEIDEAYCRIRLKYHATSSDSTWNDYQTAQIEVGNKATELAGYNEVCDYIFESPNTEIPEQSNKKEIKLLAIGDSFLLEAFVYAPILMRNMFPDINLEIGIAYEGYESNYSPAKGGLPAFLSYLTTNPNHTVSYFRYDSKTEKWGSGLSRSMNDIIQAEDWDCVVIRVNSGTGITSSGYLHVGEKNTEVILYYKWNSTSKKYELCNENDIVNPTWNSSNTDPSPLPNDNGALGYYKLTGNVYVQGYSSENYDYNGLVDRIRDEIMKLCNKPIKFGGILPQKKPTTYYTTKENGETVYHYYTEEQVLNSQDDDLAELFPIAENYMEKSLFDFIIPEGTAIQNARRIHEINVFGDYANNGYNQTGAGFFDYDDPAKHLQDGIGRQICGYAVCLKMLEYEYKSIFGDKYSFNTENVDNSLIPFKKGTPTGFKDHTDGEDEDTSKNIDDYNRCLLRIIQKCVFMANKYPYQVQTTMSNICAVDIAELTSLEELLTLQL